MKSVLFLLGLITFPFFLSAQSPGEFIPQQFVQEGDTLNYQILYPDGFSEEKEYPLVLFLHGAGERGNDNISQLTHGKELFLGNKEYPAIVVFPQCPRENYWSNVDVIRETNRNTFHFRKDKEPTKPLALVMTLLEEILQKDFVKKDQVYVGGLSMGAMGTFELLSRKPETFAAAIAICGAGDTEAVNSYANITELWIFHGARDKVVRPEGSIEMATAINDAGGIANLTIYGNAEHNSWDAAFSEPQLLDWLFSKSL